MKTTSNLKQMEFHYYYNEFGLTKAKSKQRSMLGERCTMLKLLILKYGLSLFANSFWSKSSCNKQLYVSKQFSKSQIIYFFSFLLHCLAKEKQTFQKWNFRIFQTLLSFDMALHLLIFNNYKTL